MNKKRLLKKALLGMTVLLTTGFAQAAEPANSGPLDLSTLTTTTTLEFTADGQWKSTPQGGVPTVFNGTIIGKGKDTEFTMEQFIKIRNNTTEAATLTFDNVNVKTTQTISSYIDDGAPMLTIILKDTQIKGGAGGGIIGSAISCSPTTVKVDENSEGPSKLIAGNNNSGISFPVTELTVDGGTKGLEVTGNLAVANTNKAMTIKGKVALRGRTFAISSYNTSGLSIDEGIIVASEDDEAISIESGVTTTPVFQWSFETAPAEGTLTVKEGNTEVASYATDGKLRTFAISGGTGKEYTLWYTPKDGTEKQQQDGDGVKVFKATDNGLFTFEKMADASDPAADEPLDISTLTTATELKFMGNGQWTSTPAGGEPTPFNGTIKGKGKDTEFTMEQLITIYNNTTEAATLTFDNVNVKITQRILSYISANAPMLTIILKDTQIKGGAGGGIIGSATSCSPTTVKVDENSEGPSKLIADNNNSGISFPSTELTVDGGTKGLEVTGRTAVSNTNKALTIKGKVALRGRGFAISSYNTSGLSIDEGVIVASEDDEAISIGNEGVTTTPVFQWYFETAPAEGTLTVKEGNTEVASCVTDDKLRTFAISGGTGKEYTLWYTPKGGTEKQQQDKNGVKVFKATGNSLFTFEEMADASDPAADEPLDISTLTTDLTIDFTADGKWTSAPKGTTTTTPFNGVIKGDGKEITLNKRLEIKNTSTQPATLTFEDVNIKTSVPVINIITATTDAMVTVNLKDVQINGSGNGIISTYSRAAGPITIMADETSKGASKLTLIGTDDRNITVISLSGTEATVNGGTKGIEIESTGIGISNKQEALTITGKVNVKSGYRSLMSTNGKLGIGEQVTTASADIPASAIYLGTEGKVTTPALLWNFATAPAEGKLVIKSGTAEVASFDTDGKMVSFVMGAVKDKEYTVWYTPKDGAEKQQQDGDGVKIFKATDNGLFTSEGMTEMTTSTTDGPLDFNTLTAPTSLTYKNGQWTSKSNDSSEPTPFNGVIKSDGKEFTMDKEIGVYASSTEEATLTFENVNVKMTKIIEIVIYKDAPMLTIKLKDSQIEGSDQAGVIGGDVTMGPITIMTDETSESASKVIANNDNASAIKVYSPLTIDGGTKGLEVTAKKTAVRLMQKALIVKGKVALRSNTSNAIYNYNSTGTSLSEGVEVASANADAVYASGTLLAPISQWSYAEALAEGTLAIKSGATVVASFKTDGQLKSFATGAIVDKEYTVWYTPKDGEEKQQQDGDGVKVFKATDNSLSKHKMGAPGVGIQTTEADTIPAVSYVYSIDGRLVKTVPAEEYSTLKNGLSKGVYIVNGKKIVIAE